MQTTEEKNTFWDAAFESPDLCPENPLPDQTMGGGPTGGPKGGIGGGIPLPKPGGGIPLPGIMGGKPFPLPSMGGNGMGGIIPGIMPGIIPGMGGIGISSRSESELSLPFFFPSLEPRLRFFLSFFFSFFCFSSPSPSFFFFLFLPSPSPPALSRAARFNVANSEPMFSSGSQEGSA